MVIRALLEGSIKGVGKFGKTPIFPCGIFQCMDGVNRKEGDANYDLFLLALKSTSLRLYPNYANVQWSGNKGFDPENPSTYFSTMGCVSLDAKISVMVDGEYAEITIGDFWEFCHNRFGYKNQAELGYSDTGFYSDLEGVFIKDKDGYVKCNRIIKNTNNPLVFDNGKLTKWYLIQLESGKHVKCTADHPWTLKRGDEILAENVKIGDIAFSLNEDGRLVEDKVVEIKIISEDPKRVDESFDVSTESEHFIVNGIYTHNCRTANGYDINADDPKLVQLKDGRGNICPVTLILPELAMKAKKKLDKELAKEGNEAIAKKEYESRLKAMFLTILDQKIGEAKDMLLERFEWICSQSPKSARFMYENGTMYGYKPEEGIRSALRHGTLAIGQLGLAETLQILIGCDHTETKGLDFAKVIEQKFKDRCLEFKNKYRLNFGVYYTPAENLCYTAMKKFKAKHGVIEKVSDREFFTNSIHCPVWKKLTPFEKIDIESQLTGYSSAGCITYVEMDSSTKNNIEALEKLVNYAMDKDIPYFAINIPNDTCDECGYTGDIARECPKCGSTKIQRLRRVTGYLTGDYKTAFNKGKQEETESRVKHVSVEA